jgi:hypothetical protein
MTIWDDRDAPETDSIQLCAGVVLHELPKAAFACKANILDARSSN